MFSLEGERLVSLSVVRGGMWAVRLAVSLNVGIPR